MYTPYVNKFYTLAASQMLLLVSGISYAFPLWCQHLKVGRFAYDQTQVQLIASIADIVRVSSSIAAGLLFNAKVAHHPHAAPRVLLLSGAAATATGYMLLWAGLRGVIPLRYWQVAGLFALASSGSGWTDIAPVSLTGMHFTHSRGTVLALAKAWVGLSASVFSAAYFILSAQGQGIDFVGVLALVPLVVSLMMTPLVNAVPFVQQHEGPTDTARRFAFGYVCVMLVAFYQATVAMLRALTMTTISLTNMMQPVYDFMVNPVVSAISNPMVNTTSTVSPAARLTWERSVGSVLLLLLGCAFWVVVAGSGGLWAVQDRGSGERRTGRGAREPLVLGHGGADDAEVDLAALDPSLPDIPPWHAIRHVNFWLMLCSSTTVIGTGLLLLNNLTQLVLSLHGTATTAAIGASLFSVCNCLGRLWTGWASERMLHTRGTPRTRFLIATTLASLLACILGSLSLPTLVLPVAVISGLAFGACWTLLATLAADLFGIAHLAGNYTVLQLAPALGNILFSTVLAGQLYQVVGRRQGDPVNTCMGKACFGWSLVVSSMACVVAVVCAVVLDRRAASLYAKEYEELHAWDDQES